MNDPIHWCSMDEAIIGPLKSCSDNSDWDCLMATELISSCVIDEKNVSETTALHSRERQK